MRKGERTRLAILRVTGELLLSHSPAGIKIEDIAHAADLSPSALYRYFPSKDALLLAFAEDAYEVLERYRAEVQGLPSPLQRVYAAGDAYLQLAIDRPAFVRLMISRGLQPPDDPSLSDVNERVSARMRELVMQAAVDLRESMRTGEMPTAPLDETVIMLFGLWNGVAGLIVRADGTAIPAELALRALERSRTLLHRAIAHELESPEPPLLPWEREATDPPA